MFPSRTRRARHRSPGRSSDAVEAGLTRDGELDPYLAALASDVGPASTELTGCFGSAQVFVLRLPALHGEQLRRIAHERGVTPGALAVHWVVERLTREDTRPGRCPPSSSSLAAAACPSSDAAERLAPTRS